MSERHEPSLRADLPAGEPAAHEATKPPAPVPAIGDIAIPLNPDMAADVLLAGAPDPGAPDDPGAEH